MTNLPPQIKVSQRDRAVWYVSGEENPEQIASRAVRLGMDEPELCLLLLETLVDALTVRADDCRTSHENAQHWYNNR